MAKKISDDELIEIAGGTDGAIVDLNKSDGDEAGPSIGRGPGPGEGGGVGGTGLDSEGTSDGIQDLN